MAAVPRRELADERFRLNLGPTSGELHDDHIAKTANHPALIQCRLHMRFEEAEST